MKTLLLSHGWTWMTAVSMLLFSLFHWPCSTTCITIYKETKSWKWTAASMVLPTMAGVIFCAVFANLARLILN